MEFIYFLGRFHVLALHIPIGVIIAAASLELLARQRKYQHFAPAIPYLWGFAAVTAIATVILGFMHFAEGGFDGTTAEMHKRYGIGVALVTTSIWFFRTRWNPAHSIAGMAPSVLVLFLLTMTGHYGGNLTHGSTYLVEYAPQPLRTLAGLEAERPPVTDPALADVYLDVVAPMLESRCGNCHNDSKRQGELNLSTAASILRGGESGAVVMPGNAEGSELYRRITLPSEHEDYMPAEGKTPLTESQVAILAWWIDAGAVTDVKLADLDIPAKLAPMLSQQLQLDSAMPATAIAQPGVSRADAAQVEALYQAGFVVRQLSASDPLLVVRLYSPGTDPGPAQWATLMTAAPNIAELDLQRANLQDEDLASLDLTQFSNLTHLKLNDNQLSDAGVAGLQELPRVEYLNLSNNRDITDASVDALQALPHLSKLFVWETAISNVAEQQLQMQLAAKRQDAVTRSF